VYGLSIGNKYGDLAWAVTVVKVMSSLIHAAGYSESQLVPLEEVCAAQKYLRDIDTVVLSRRSARI